jgi:peptidoglycan/LPS O-acetylase OafA/YrhL|tara:strand:+ start:352 stop:1596 length:1245 start_codon:yes stop_codon:yes gene_type:complete
VNVFIRQLTGIRLVAAVWVLLYHSQGPLDAIGVLSIPVLPDFIRVGRLGVDLFFALSGFILAHTYLSSLGERLKVDKSAKFLWLRLARIYPVHLVMLLVAGFAVFAQSIVTGEELDRSWLNPWDFIKNLLLIQEWGSDPQRGWNFVAWSLSMEWLAYLIFPFMALVLWRMHKHLPTWALCLFWIMSLTPLVIYGLGSSDPYYTENWGSTYRVLTAFTAGAISYLIVDRLRDSDRAAAVCDVLAFVLPAIVVAASVFLAWLPAAVSPITSTDPDAEPLPPLFHLTLVPVLIAWIGVLALSRRGMANLLATKIMVFGGFISYSLYMTHLVWFGLWRAGMKALGIESGPLYALSVVFLLGMSFVIAYVMWRLVEEPARIRMRTWIGIRPTPTEEAGEAIVDSTDPTTATPIDVPGRE